MNFGAAPAGWEGFLLRWRLLLQPVEANASGVDPALAGVPQGEGASALVLVRPAMGCWAGAFPPIGRVWPPWMPT